MSLTVLVSSTPIKHSHYHHCFVCGKHVYETNVVCKREVDHDFPCANHLQHYRDELGMFDSLVDAIITREEAYRFQQEWAMDEEPTVLYDQFGNAHRVHSPR